MDQIAWIIWLALGVCLIIAEIFTLGFVLFWFGVGAIAAALAGLLGIGLGGQFLVFAVVSIALTAMSRTIFAKYFAHGETMKMGMDALPGQIGTVTAESKGALNEGAVKVYGSTWTAYPEDGEQKLVAGEKVQVVRIAGSSLYVQRVTDELPEWRANNDSSKNKIKRPQY
jgi:membrane protein implicated in regulation of membrane protease activity